MNYIYSVLILYMASKPFKFDKEFRESEEYRLYKECLFYNDVPVALHDTLIIAHKMDPFFYKRNHKMKPIEKTEKNCTYEVIKVDPNAIEIQ